MNSVAFLLKGIAIFVASMKIYMEVERKSTNIHVAIKCPAESHMDERKTVRSEKIKDIVFRGTINGIHTTITSHTIL